MTIRRALLALIALLAPAVLMTGCSQSHYDPDLCDFYQSLGVDYTASQGYVPSKVQQNIDRYCTR